MSKKKVGIRTALPQSNPCAVRVLSPFFFYPLLFLSPSSSTTVAVSPMSQSTVSTQLIRRPRSLKGRGWAGNVDPPLFSPKSRRGMRWTGEIGCVSPPPMTLQSVSSARRKARNSPAPVQVSAGKRGGGGGGALAAPVAPRSVFRTADLLCFSLPTEGRGKGGGRSRERRCGDSGGCVGGRWEEGDQGARVGGG